MKKVLFAPAFILFSLLSYAQPPAGNAEPGDHYGSMVKTKGAILLSDKEKLY